MDILLSLHSTDSLGLKSQINSIHNSVYRVLMTERSKLTETFAKENMNTSGQLLSLQQTTLRGKKCTAVLATRFNFPSPLCVCLQVVFVGCS